MRKINNFVNCYDLSKTLRFRLVPEGKTLENFEKDKQLERDILLSENYGHIKELLDEFYKDYIEQSLKKAEFFKEDFNEYAELFFKGNKSDKDEARLKALKDIFYKAVKNSFTIKENEADPFEGKMIKTTLLPFVQEKDKATVESFVRFSTYLNGFFANRKNIITTEGKSTEVVYRIFDQNLPKFLNNIKIFRNRTAELFAITDKSDARLKALVKVEDIFSPQEYGKFITQSGIDVYNAVIGGFVANNGEKIKGLNEYINEYNQILETKIPKLNMLYKQILSDRLSVSFLPEQFNDDKEVFDVIEKFYTVLKNDSLDKIKSVFFDLNKFDFSNVYIDYKYVSIISEKEYSDWHAIKDLLQEDYDSKVSEKERNTKKYQEIKDKYFKNLKIIKIEELERISKIDLKEHFAKIWQDLYFVQDAAWETLNAASKPKSLQYDKLYIEKLKNFMDSIKEIERFVKLFDYAENGTSLFYTECAESFDKIKPFAAIYDKVRNYVTQKPYDTEKIKINFDNSQLLGGWDISKEENYNSVLLRRNGNYYLAIMRKDCNKVFRDIKETDETEYYEKMVYKYLPSPSKMLPKVCFSAKNKSIFNPSERIEKIRKNGLFKKSDNFDKDALWDLIDFYKDCIKKYDSWRGFDFNFAPTREYDDISGFYKDVESAGYSVKFIKVSAHYIDLLAEEGKLYLFHLYNKDFSTYSHGTKNLHTLYFTEIFSEENLKNPVFKLNGEAELFYRPASIPTYKPTHPKNQPIKNKRENYKKKTSVFNYDLIKNKRYTENQFFFHVPMQLNFIPNGNGKINLKVRQALKETKNNYVIGIDRGERNLLYVCVIDENGKIVEQESLNVIDGQNYYTLLSEREKSREKARKEWQDVKNIKDLKTGYLSLVVNKICKLIEKYDAIVAMENLNIGFKNTRSGIEKSVYQQFEKALIDKLNFYVNKSTDKNDFGGLRKAYQLTEKFDSFSKMGKQNGFLFYIPAWKTSKIDPITGFVDLLNPKYKSVDDTKSFIDKFKDIRYQDGMFAFSFDYSDFPRTESDYKKKWTIYTYGERIVSFRNETKAGSWDTKTVSITNELKSLFDSYGIDYEKGNIKLQILEQNEKEFFQNLIKLIALTLQMRNSIPNTDIDYIISPVKNASGKFFDSRYAVSDLPKDADANGAYHIALKGLMTINNIKAADDVSKANMYITNAEWLKYRQ